MRELKPTKFFNLDECKKCLKEEFKNHKNKDIEHNKRHINDLEYLLENIDSFNRNMIAEDIKKDIELEIKSTKKLIKELILITENVKNIFLKNILINYKDNDGILFFHYVIELYQAVYTEYKEDVLSGKMTTREIKLLEDLITKTVEMFHFAKKNEKDFLSKKSIDKGTTRAKSHSIIKKPLLNAFDTVIEYSELVEYDVLTQNLKDLKNIANSFHFVSESKLLRKFYRELFHIVYAYLIEKDGYDIDEETGRIQTKKELLDYYKGKIEKKMHDKVKAIVSIYMECIYKKPSKIPTIKEREIFSGFSYLSPFVDNKTQI